MRYRGSHGFLNTGEVNDALAQHSLLYTAEFSIVTVVHDSGLLSLRSWQGEAQQRCIKTVFNVDQRGSHLDEDPVGGRQAACHDIFETPNLRTNSCP